MPVQSERSLMPMGNTLVVSIPIGWARYYRLKAKDKVILTVDGELVIRPKRKVIALQSPSIVDTLDSIECQYIQDAEGLK